MVTVTESEPDGLIVITDHAMATMTFMVGKNDPGAPQMLDYLERFQGVLKARGVKHDVYTRNHGGRERTDIVVMHLAA